MDGMIEIATCCVVMTDAEIVRAVFCVLNSDPRENQLVKAH